MIDHSRLLDIIDYSPKTGLFRWRPRSGVRKGRLAGSLQNKGYLRVYVEGRSYLQHRLAWFYMTGAWPPEDIDHINGDRKDNRFVNLRCVSRAVNLQNQKRAKGNTACGLLGVQRNKKRFAARIYVLGAPFHLGTYDTPEEAHSVYLRAKRRLHEGCTI